MKPWDQFWKAGSDGALSGAGADRLKQFWADEAASGDVFAGECVLDLGGGSGALRPFIDGPAAYLPVDLSFDALRSARSAARSSRAIAADCRALPFVDGSIAAAVSQFGVEYAGLDGFREAGRVLAPGGAFTALVHIKGGGVDIESARDRAAATVVLSSGVLAAVRDAFFLAAGRAPFGVTAEVNRSALTAGADGLKRSITEHGAKAANGLAKRLFDDIAVLFSKMSAYDPDDIARWTSALSSDIDAYANRLAAMQRAAMDQTAVRQAMDALSSNSVEHATDEPSVLSAAGAPIAWVLKGRKQKAGVA